MTKSQPSQKSPANPLSFLASANFSKLSLVSLGLVSLGFVTLATFHLIERTKVHRLTLAAGAIQGESFIISKAIELVVEKYHPNIQIDVKETEGTEENIQLLQKNQVQLATAQADVPVGSNASLISILFPDKFQLIVPNNSNIKQFSELRGKRIALPKGGGQFQSFIQIATHFGLSETDFIFVGKDEQSANAAFQANQADAAFRVRALPNPSISQLVRNGSVKLVPLEQAAAMKIKYPAFEPGMIPQGAYRGSPPIPATDLATVQVQRTLLASIEVDPEVIRNIAIVIFEHRQELADAIQSTEIKPLVANISRPAETSGLGAPIHPGAQAYYDRNQPSFIQQNADFMALILTVVLLLWSWVVQLKRMLQRIQKNAADEYTKKALDLLNKTPKLQTVKEVEMIREQLLELLAAAVADLDKDVISEKSFQSFRVIWQIALDVVRERGISLFRQQATRNP